MGRRAGERVFVKLGEDDGYWMDILKIEKGSDDGSILFVERLIHLDRSSHHQ